MGYIIHTLFHFLVGASVTYILVNKDYDSKSNKIFVLIFGGFIGVSPDVPKLFGDILGHTIWFAPVFGLIFAVLFRTFDKHLAFIKGWLIFSVTVFIGHILIDYLGNGVALLYPLIREELDFSIIGRNEEFIIFILLFTLIISIFYRNGKKVIFAGVIFVSLYLLGLSVSKILLEQHLKNIYEADNINLLITYPSYNSLEWEFHIRTDKAWTTGNSSVFGSDINIIRERIVED